MKGNRALGALVYGIALTALSSFIAVEAAPGAWTDPTGDVTLANADILSGSATVSGGMVDLRMQFSAPPFPTTATHHIGWCLDTDQSAATGSACGFSDLLGADRGLTLWGGLDALSTCDFSLEGNVPGLESSYEIWFDPATNTLRLLFPLSLISDHAVFDYVVLSVFGGSFGANDWAPGSAGFGSPGGYFTSDVGELPPFEGAPLCDTGESFTIDIKPGSFPNSINPRSQGVIPVAVLTNGAFDAATVDTTTVHFGAHGMEAAPVHVALQDVDGDGDEDLILHFRTKATGIQCGDASASLTGKTLAGEIIEGSDSINTVGCHRKQAPRDKAGIGG